MTMREVKLYGHLGKRFGRVFRLDVSSAAEAIAALRANLDGFTKYLTEHSEPGYHILVGKRSLGQDDLREFAHDTTIKIIPAVAGAKRSGALQTIIGVALVVVGVVFSNPALIKAGATLAVSGVAQMLSQPPKPGTREKPENMPSYNFNGPVNTTTQGNPVPVCYGEMLVGSQVVSFGLAVEDMYVAPGGADQNGDGNTSFWEVAGYAAQS